LLQASQIRENTARLEATKSGGKLTCSKADCPLVKDKGSTNQFIGGVGLLYSL